jgi:HEAT repeat protein
MKYFINIVFCIILISIGTLLGFYIYSSLHNYEIISYKQFSLYLKDEKVTSIEIDRDKIIVITTVKNDKESVQQYFFPQESLKYSILSLEEKDKVLESVKNKHIIIEDNTKSNTGNYLFIIPFILIFSVLGAIIVGSRRGNIKQTLFREKKFNLDSPLQKARVESITWANIMSGEPFKIKTSYGDMSSSEQDNYMLLLLKAIQSEDLEIRRKASFALREIGDSRSIGPLCKMLETDEDPHVRMNAALTLGLLKDEKAIASLEAAIKDPNPLVRGSVATALGAIGDEKSLEILTRILQEDENWRARRSAIMALMKIRDDRVITKLIEALKDAEPVVRSCAAIALGEIGVEEALPALGKLLSEENESSVKRDIIGALQAIGGDDTIQPLCQVLLNDKDVSVRLSALVAIELIEDDMVTETICTALQKDPDPDLRIGAAEALAWRKTPESMGALKKALQDDDEMVREFVAEIVNEK